MDNTTKPVVTAAVLRNCVDNLNGGCRGCEFRDGTALCLIDMIRAAADALDERDSVIVYLTAARDALQKEVGRMAAPIPPRPEER